DFGGKGNAKYLFTFFGGVNRPLLERVKTGVAFIGGGGIRDAQVMLENQSFEGWDGKGPGKLKGDAIDMTSRVVNLADVVEVYHRAGDVDAARDVARQRSGSQFDPDVVAAFCDEAELVFSDLDGATTWDAIIAAEPALQPTLTDEQFCTALDAIADFTDVKSPYTLGHSRGVAELVAEAGRTMNLAADEVEQLR